MNEVQRNTGKSVEDQIRESSFISQIALLDSPADINVLSGTRGGGKSRAILNSFLKHVDRYKEEWHGIYFRRRYKDLEAFKREARKVFKYYYPEAEFNKSESIWYFPNGATYSINHGLTEEDAGDFQGHQYAHMSFDELTTFPDMKFYDAVRGSNRSSNPMIKCVTIIACNPYGPNHNKVKQRFISRAGWYEFYVVDGLLHLNISSSFIENKYILNQDVYLKTLLSDPNPQRRRAWVLNDWDIVSGGIIDDCYSRTLHRIKKLTQQEIKDNLEVDVILDWGSAKPYAVLFIARARQSFVSNNRIYLRGDIFIIDEIYGSVGENKGTGETPRQVEDKIIEKIKKEGYHVIRYLADNQIFQEHGIPSIATHFERLNFEAVKKGHNSRIQTLNILREKLMNAKPDKFNNREKTALYITENCINWLNITPTITRSERNPEDSDENAEDHLYDCTRYYLQYESMPVKILEMK